MSEDDLAGPSRGPRHATGRDTPGMNATQSGTPRIEPTSLESAGSFVAHAGLVFERSVQPASSGTSSSVGSPHPLGNRPRWCLLHGHRKCSEHRGKQAVAARGEVAVGLTNTTHFLRSLASGRVEVDARAVYQGRTHQLWQANVTDESGRLVAHGEVRLQNVQAGRPIDRTLM